MELFFSRLTRIEENFLRRCYIGCYLCLSGYNISVCYSLAVDLPSQSIALCCFAMYNIAVTC